MADAQILLRNDIAANWSTNNPVLGTGEAGYETDTGRLKFGDGATAWNSLAYFTAGEGGGGITSDISGITGGLPITNIVAVSSQGNYDAIPTKSATTLYFIPS